MTLLFALALAHSSFSFDKLESVSKVTSRDNPAKSGGEPLIFTRSTKLSDFKYDGEIWLKDGDFSLQGVSCKGIRLSNVQSATLTKVQTNGADVGLLIIGGGNVSVKNSVFRNHRIGIEGGPGHPWTFEAEARLRGIGRAPGAEWIMGMNLCGMLETRNQGISFIGNGTNKVTIALGKNPNPPFKLDSLPLSNNHWDISGKNSAYVVSETSNSVVLGAEGVFQSGVKYWAHGYNQNYELNDIRITDSRFEMNNLAGVSLYFTNNVWIERNYCPDVTTDYEFGLEHSRNAFILDNRSNYGQNRNNLVRIGLLGRMENIVMRGNDLPLAFMHRNQPELGIVADKPINYTNGSRSPWILSVPATINP